jgi:glycine C-acetyltransferase
LFSSCFDANGGVFEALFGEEDAIISDELNHASIIDGIRLSKAARFRYKNRDMADLERALTESAGAKSRVIVTDGVFSMDGYIAPLREICDLAEKYNAVVMVDDSHAVGLIGAGGKGTPELLGVGERVDIYTGTFGKALGGAAGGYVSGRASIVELLRQKARPYLFSNSLAPVIAAGSLEAIRIASDLTEGPLLRSKLQENTKLFRELMLAEGFDLIPGEHPIIAVMFGDARLATEVANRMFIEGIYVTAFSFPVVPKDKARIRVQLSAAHSTEEIKTCVAAFRNARAQVRVV